MTVLFIYTALAVTYSIYKSVVVAPGSIPENKEWDIVSDSATGSGTDEERKKVLADHQDDKGALEPLTNYGIEENSEYPRDPNDLDLKYIKSKEGHLIGDK